jgi:hypothetical protein
MKKYTVKAYAVDWCGYESFYEVEAISEKEAMDKAIGLLADEYDLMLFDQGEYGEMEDFDEDGLPVEDAELTTLSAQIIED